MRLGLLPRSPVDFIGKLGEIDMELGELLLGKIFGRGENEAAFAVRLSQTPRKIKV